MIIKPEWDAPHHITAFTTTRLDGASQAPYHHFNLALHTGDNPQHVEQNRQRLMQTYNLPNEPCWLTQTHSDKVIHVDHDETREADAAITSKSNQVLAIMTGDCMPILISNRNGNEIAAIHAGWRGLAQGIVENTIHSMQSQSQDLIAWIGPAICETCFEVGDDVKSAFISQYDFVEFAFVPAKHDNKWYANMSAIAKLIFNQLGITSIFESKRCTIEEENLFYSYRREGATGRIASLIWINAC